MKAAPATLRLAVLLALMASLSAMAVPSHAAWLSEGTPAAPGEGAQSGPVIASDGAGGAYLAWQDYRTGNATLFAQHLTAEGIAASGWPFDMAWKTFPVKQSPFTWPMLRIAQRISSSFIGP